MRWIACLRRDAGIRKAWSESGLHRRAAARRTWVASSRLHVADVSPNGLGEFVSGALVHGR